MKQAGSNGLCLNEETMNCLWMNLANQRMLKFNQEADRQQLHALKQVQAKLWSSLSVGADLAATHTEIYPNRYQAAGFGDKNPEALKKMT